MAIRRFYGESAGVILSLNNKKKTYTINVAMFFHPRRKTNGEKMNQCSSVFEIEELIRLSAYREKSCGPKFSVTYSAACCEVCVVVMQSDIVFLFRQSLLLIFFFFARNPKEPQTNRACFEKKKKRVCKRRFFFSVESVLVNCVL